MKKSMIAGSVAGIGMALMIVAGMRTQGFSWNDVAFIVGSMCVTFGGVHLAQLLEEVLNAREQISEDTNKRHSDLDDPVVRPFNLSGGESRRA